MTFRRIWIAVALVVIAGCAAPQTRAHRAFDEGEYDRAFAEYKQLIDEGADDWKVYYRAAKSATHIGNFAVAEKYYSHALRKGGGATVARDFANFYLKTSNYTKAVRLLQFLLEVEEDKQPIYNNIGTAMMYAGAPLDAETYLLIAQQMNPEDPVPYVNLGVLYERHMRQPGIAVDFYRCYLELADGGSTQHERIKSRVSELASSGRDVPTNVNCGEPYYRGGGGRKKNVDVDKKMEELGGKAPSESDASNENKGEPIELDLGPKARKQGGDGPRGSFEGMGDESGDGTDGADGAEGDASAATKDAGTGESSGDGGSEARADAGDAGGDGETTDSEEPSIERAGKSNADRSDHSAAPDGAEASTVDRAAVLQRARAAFDEENYETVVDEISKLSLQQLNIEAMRIYGLSLAELGENEDARQWLDWVVDRKPNPETVGALLIVYERLGQKEARRQICQKFREREAYQKVTESCPSPVEDPPEEKLQKLREMKRNERNQ